MIEIAQESPFHTKIDEHHWQKQGKNDISFYEFFQKLKKAIEA